MAEKRKPAPLHKSITAERVTDLLENEPDANLGLCRACGAERGDCEPDAEFYECESCRQHQVFGLETLLLEVAI